VSSVENIWYRASEKAVFIILFILLFDVTVTKPYRIIGKQQLLISETRRLGEVSSLIFPYKTFFHFSIEGFTLKFIHFLTCVPQNSLN